MAKTKRYSVPLNQIVETIVLERAEKSGRSVAQVMGGMIENYLEALSIIEKDKVSGEWKMLDETSNGHK